MSTTAINREGKQFVIFKLDGEEFGIPIMRVHTVEKMMRLTKVPKAPAFIEGVTNLRGEVVPVMSLRRRFGLMTKVADEKTHIIMMKTQDESETVGLIVDEISQVLHLSDNLIEQTPEIVGEIDTLFISGIGKKQERLIVLLNPDEIIDTAL